MTTALGGCDDGDSLVGQFGGIEPGSESDRGRAAVCCAAGDESYGLLATGYETEGAHVAFPVVTDHGRPHLSGLDSSQEAVGLCDS
jgi:hypothetical protein